MRCFLSVILPIAAAFAFCSASSAATVRFDIVPTDAPDSTSVTVTPGSEIPYSLYAQVTSDDATTSDNNGLAFFSVDVLTTLGVMQPALDSFDPLISQRFVLLAKLGTPTAPDDILQIGASQNTLVGGTPQAGIAVNRQLLGQGRLVTPSTEGSFTVTLADTSLANTFKPSSIASTTTATVMVGSGFTIQTSTSTVASQNAAAARNLNVVTGSFAYIALGLLVVLAAFLTLGPLAGLIMVVLFPLLMLGIALNL